METQNQQQALEDIKNKIKDINIAMLVTEEPDGTLRSRPMATNKMEDDGSIWFFTGEYSPKVAEVNENHKVNISYADPDKNVYVSVSGQAYLVTDKNKIDELWKPFLKAWFPKGKEDPNVALLKVVPQKAEYWDSESSKMILAFNVVKAILSGEKHESNEHKKLNL
jgi:general stress protein 26